jgi:hypothetical protein
MSVPLLDVPLLDPLTAPEVAAALGVKPRAIGQACGKGWIPGAFRTPGLGNGPGHWRIPRDSVLQLRRELGVDP